LIQYAPQFFAPPPGHRAFVNRPLQTLSCLLLLLSACGDANIAPAAEDEALAPVVGRTAGTARFDIVSFSRLGSFYEGVPCNPDLIPPFPAAAALTRELRTESDHALLVCIDDSLQQSGSFSKKEASKAATNARAELFLETMALAEVDAYIPGHGDFLRFGVKGLLQKTQELGLPVLVSNLDLAEPMGVQQQLLLEADGIIIACLGAIPLQAKGDVSEEGVTIVKPVRRIKQLAKGLTESGEADIIVVFSALSNKTNQRLSDTGAVHFIIGTNEQGQNADRIVQRSNTNLMGQRFYGHEAGHTTLNFVDGDFRLVDISGLWRLPKEMAKEGAVIDGWLEQYQTDDLDVLVQRISPIQEPDLPGRLEMREANSLWLSEFADYEGSYVAHRPADLTQPDAADAVLASLSRQADVIQTALAALTEPPAALAAESSLPQDSTCVSCHREQHDHWAATAHASAYERLTELGREQDGSCLTCHSVGFNAPGGYKDPRQPAPFGAVSCWTCHRTHSYHATLTRGAVDHSLSGTTNREFIEERCETCHSKRRSPGFELEAAMASIACPPMRPDSPDLTKARKRAIQAIDRHEQAGTSDPLDLYRKGRAFMGLGRIDEGIAAIQAFADTLEDQPEGVAELAHYLDEFGASHEAIALVREFLVTSQGDPALNTEYVRLMLEATDESAQDPSQAERRIRQVTPDDGDKIKAALLPMRMMQVDALFRIGNDAEAFRLLHRLNTAFPRHDEVQAFVDRWLGDRG